MGMSRLEWDGHMHMGVGYSLWLAPCGGLCVLYHIPRVCVWGGGGEGCIFLGVLEDVD